MDSSAPPSSTPFFHRRETHQLVDRFRELDDLTIYVGAGSSVERTGLTWSALTAELLPPELGTFEQRVKLTTALTPLGTSSIVEEVHRKQWPAGWRARIQGSIRSLLLKGDESVTGTFNERVASLVSMLQLKGKSVCVVTPNYDDFLIKNLAEAGVPFKLIVLGARNENDAEAFAVLKKRLDEIQESIADRGAVTLVHLHGLVTLDDSDYAGHAKGIFPVVSEADYNETAEQSKVALQYLFEERNALILGSSVTDPPLISALLATRPVSETVERWTVVPLQGITPLEGDHLPRPDLVTAHKRRLSHLGSELVCPDYFIQVPQLVEEFRFVHTFDDSETYSDALSKNRYGRRLEAWWQDWYFGPTELAVRQHRDHEILAQQTLPDVRKALGAPIDEPLRIEIWLRWMPSSNRELALWCSSVGTWADADMMRRDTVSSKSKYVSVRAFTAGGISYLADPPGPGRWRSYFSKPVWFTDEGVSGQTVSIPVGVISVASMWEQKSSALAPGNWSKAAAVSLILDDIASRIVTPEMEPDES